MGRRGGTEGREGRREKKGRRGGGERLPSQPQHPAVRQSDGQPSGARAGWDHSVGVAGGKPREAYHKATGWRWPPGPGREPQATGASWLSMVASEPLTSVLVLLEEPRAQRAGVSSTRHPPNPKEARALGAV